MKIYFFVCVLLSVDTITGLDPALDGDPRRSFPIRRAIDGSRGRKYYVPDEEDTFETHGASGQYDPYRDTTDIRANVPGEPGVDYPSYVTIPQTSFQCQNQYRGYYADEDAGCQLFHVCDGNFLVSSFLCPIGSTFSQKLLTCDWWNKVDCSSTRNYHIVNRDSLLSEVDDDEILRKAYEMTSLQTAAKGVSIDSRTRNSILQSARFINDLQTTGNRYRDYTDDSPEPQSKYSSRYNSGDYPQSLGYDPMTSANQHNPNIKVHTIGQDHKNDGNHETRDFRPSYAPTVPTVTTTTRRFYSPTVPTTSARPMSRPRHDLEFESSDHLYSARGKMPEPAIFPVTGPTIDTTTSVVVEVPPTLTETSKSRIEKSQPETVTEVTMDKADVVTQFSAIEFQSVYSGENYTFQIDIDDQHNPPKQAGPIGTPASNIIPPFFYYSNVDQHDALQETPGNSTSASPFIINVPATDVIPPLSNEFINETRKNHVDNRLLISSEALQSTPSAEEKLPDPFISPPSKLFLPPIDHFHALNSTDVIHNDVGDGLIIDSNEQNSGGKPRDSTGGESSPYQVSLSVKGQDELNPRALIKNFLAHHESSGDIRDIEISQSQRAEPLSLLNNSSDDSSAAGDASRAQIINYAVLNKLQEIRSLVPSATDLENADHLPRPFSLENRRATEKSPSGGPGGSERTGEMTESHSHEVELRKKGDTPLEFDVPPATGIVEFGDEKLEDLEEQVSGEKEQKFEKEDNGDTEFIPSIGFSLNTAEERKEYTEAVIRGLFTDLSIPNVNRSTENSES